MTIDNIIKSGDRVEFKRFIAERSIKDLKEAWIKACVAKVQDFQELAWNELERRANP